MPLLTTPALEFPPCLPAANPSCRCVRFFLTYIFGPGSASLPPAAPQKPGDVVGAGSPARQWPRQPPHAAASAPFASCVVLQDARRRHCRRGAVWHVTPPDLVSVCSRTGAPCGDLACQPAHHSGAAGDLGGGAAVAAPQFVQAINGPERLRKLGPAGNQIAGKEGQRGEHSVSG
jgi:hypothetical protein